MNTFISLVITIIGLVLSYPLTIIRIAWEESENHTNWIRKQLTGTSSREEMRNMTREDLVRFKKSRFKEKMDEHELNRPQK